MVKYIICILMAAAGLGAQAQDSIAGSRPDTQRRVQQAVRQGSPVAQRRPVQPASPAGDSVNALHFFGRRDTLTAWQGSMDLDTAIYARHPYFRFVNPVRFGITVKQWQGKEAVFYSIVGLLMIFALIRNGFLRYIGDLFKIFFRTTVKQR
ncbi:MAG TPA: hypothetical protein VFR58_18280, partial [Flavisolibacter sp.]|nr:hypothetical protein [Flavisolibacter sp.]